MDIQMTSQTIQTLLDILCEYATNNLSTSEKSLRVLMGEILDKLLLSSSEFMPWYYQMVEWIRRLQQRILVLKEAMVSVKPITYVGRVIISTTDDTERKVVANYGGKRWRRIENFLRGVSLYDPTAGDKTGEEYVCLRQSNVPNHVHKVSIKTTSETGVQKWLDKDAPGTETRVVNESATGGGSQLKSTSLEYQISPLERERATPPMPHDNVPPHVEVYMWECVEVDDYDREASGELKSYDSLCMVTFLRSEDETWVSADNVSQGTQGNSGTASVLSKIRQIGKGIGYNQNNVYVGIPALTKSGYTFLGWQSSQKDIVKKTNTNNDGKNDIVWGNEIYYAKWSKK